MKSTGDGLDDDCDSVTDDDVVDDDDDQNKAGSLFRVGISVANCRVVLETLLQTKEQAEKLKEQKEKSRQVVEDGTPNHWRYTSTFLPTPATHLVF